MYLWQPCFHLSNCKSQESPEGEFPGLRQITISGYGFLSHPRFIWRAHLDTGGGESRFFLIPFSSISHLFKSLLTVFLSHCIYTVRSKNNRFWDIVRTIIIFNIKLSWSRLITSSYSFLTSGWTWHYGEVRNIEA